MHLNQQNAAACNQYSSIQLNTAQHNSIQLNIAQCSSMKFNSPDESASLGEAARRAKRAPSASRALLGSSFMQSAGSCRDMLGAAAQCWSLLRSVPKLLNFKARFPFFVRQVSNKRLECVHVCKVSHPKGPQLTC